MRTLVLVGKIGPAFSGTHPRYSGIGSRFDFTHYGEVAFVQGTMIRDHWLLSNFPIPLDIPQDIYRLPLGECTREHTIFGRDIPAADWHRLVGNHVD